MEPPREGNARPGPGAPPVQGQKSTPPVAGSGGVQSVVPPQPSPTDEERRTLRRVEDSRAERALAKALDLEDWQTPDLSVLSDAEAAEFRKHVAELSKWRPSLVDGFLAVADMAFEPPVPSRHDRLI